MASLTKELRNATYTLVQLQMFKMLAICIDVQLQSMFEVSVN